MRRKKSIISLLLLSALLLSLLAGCSDTGKFVGTWKTTIDFSKVLNKELSSQSDSDMAEYLKMDKLPLEMDMAFNKDGTYKFSFNETSVDKAYDSLKADVRSGLEKYCQHVIDSKGISMTVDEFLATAGYSMDSLVEESMKSLSKEEFKKEVCKEAEGNWKVEKGKLYTSDSLDDKEYSDSDATAYTLKGDTLTLNNDWSDIGIPDKELVFTKEK